MSSAGWEKCNAEISEALAHARANRMCLPAKTNPGVRLLQRRVESGLLICVFPHLYEEKSYWQSLGVAERALRVIRGAALLHPEWIFCSTSAALAYGLQVSQPTPDVVHIATSPEAHSASSAHVVRHVLRGAETCIASGVRVVDIETCVADCLRTLDLPHGLAVADSFLRREASDVAGLLHMAERVRGRLERRHALRTARAANPRAENGGESVARGVMIELGYEVPMLQVEFENPFDGANPYRVDFAWGVAGDRPETIKVEAQRLVSVDGLVIPGREPDTAMVARAGPGVTAGLGSSADGPRLIIGELDGMDKYRDLDMLDGRTTLRAFSDERVRESRLTIAGASVMRFRFDEVLNRSYFSRLLDAFGVPRSTGAEER